MDHRFQPQQRQSSRSRCREKPYRASDLKSDGCDFVVSTDRVHRDGNGQFRKRTNALKIPLDPTCGNGSSIEENSFALEFRRSSSKKANATPIKTLIDEEMSKEMESRRPSPSLVARLMGLDTLPPSQAVHKRQSEMGSCFQKISSLGFQEKYVSYEDHLYQMSTKEHQEFKDVFEVMETSKLEKQDTPPIWKDMPSSKRSENDVAFIRQKFMDAKRLSTDETLQNSKELSDALEVLDSNKDLVLKFLQEPNSLFTKHLQDLKCVPPSPHASHITILKSSKVTKYESSEISCRCERKPERCTHMRKNVLNSSRKPATRLVNHSLKEHNGSLKPATRVASHSLKEHSGSLSYKMSKSRCAEAGLLPTRIVLLKPSLEKAQNTQRTVSLPGSPDNFQFGYRRHREFRRSGVPELYVEGRDRQKLSHYVEATGHKTKGSREIAREITKQMRHTIRGRTTKALASGGHIQDGGSCIVSGKLHLNNSEALRQTSDHFDDCNSSDSPSSSYSTESSVSREARKRLSERWNMTRRSQEAGVVGRGSSTLGEMLAFSDRDTPKTTLDSFIQNVSGEKLARDDVNAAWGCPSGISSRDGWKDGCPRNFPRSRSLPASSTVYGSPQPSSRDTISGNDNFSMLKDAFNLEPKDSFDGIIHQRRSFSRRIYKGCNNKPQSFNSGGDENKLPVREIHVNPDESINRTNVSNVAEMKPTVHLVDQFPVLEFKDSKMSLIINEEQMEQSMPSKLLAKQGEPAVHDRNEIVIEETSFDHPQVAPLPHGIIESDPLLSCKDVKQPSPVSVLEPPSEEDKSSSGCFERVSADLQELRMQLRLLKLESADTYAEESELILSDDDTEGESQAHLQMGDILQSFRDEEDRDFSYLLDILIDAGVHGTKWDVLASACQSPEYPVGSDFFDKLEKKYSRLEAWSRSERKQLFDLINSILAEILAPCMDLHPWVKSNRRVGSSSAREVLVEELWQTVVRQRKELNINPEEKVLDADRRWLDLGDDTDMIGREIERMLKEDLLEQLVSELIVG